MAAFIGRSRQIGIALRQRPSKPCRSLSPTLEKTTLDVRKVERAAGLLVSISLPALGFSRGSDIRSCRDALIFPPQVATLSVLRLVYLVPQIYTRSLLNLY